MKYDDFQTICVVKAANIRNWIIEIKNLTGEDAVVCKGGRPDYFILQEVMASAPYVLISYDTLGAGSTETEEQIEHREATGRPTPLKELTYPWVTIFKAAKPDFLILDEAHQIKTPDARRTAAVHLLVDIPVED